MLCDGISESLQELIHSPGDIAGALLILWRRQLPLRRGDCYLVTGGFDDDPPVRLAEPFQVERVGDVFLRVLFGP